MQRLVCTSNRIGQAVPCLFRLPHVNSPIPSDIFSLVRAR